jgi:phage shock protein E
MYQFQNPSYSDIFPNEVEQWRSRGARIIDVREAWEYDQGHIPGAELIPIGEITDRAHEITGPAVIVCASGNRSSTVADYLARIGKRDVANLNGGTFGWMRQGLPLER